MLRRRVGTPAMTLSLRKKEKSRWDLVSLGEVMLRLDPGDFRIATARQFHVFEGGGEYNVARVNKSLQFRPSGALNWSFLQDDVGLFLYTKSQILTEVHLLNGGRHSLPRKWGQIRFEKFRNGRGGPQIRARRDLDVSQSIHKERFLAPSLIFSMLRRYASEQFWVMPSSVTNIIGSTPQPELRGPKGHSKACLLST